MPEDLTDVVGGPGTGGEVDLVAADAAPPDVSSSAVGELAARTEGAEAAEDDEDDEDAVSVRPRGCWPVEEDSALARLSMAPSLLRFSLDMSNNALGAIEVGSMRPTDPPTKVGRIPGSVGM